MHNLRTPDLRQYFFTDQPGWSVEFLPIVPNEIIDPASKSIIVNPEGDEEWALAHAWAHLELGHHRLSGPLTAQEQDNAFDLAQGRLGIVDWSVLLDGPHGGATQEPVPG